MNAPSTALQVVMTEAHDLLRDCTEVFIKLYTPYSTAEEVLEKSTAMMDKLARLERSATILQRAEPRQYLITVDPVFAAFKALQEISQARMKIHAGEMLRVKEEEEYDSDATVDEEPPLKIRRVARIPTDEELAEATSMLVHEEECFVIDD